MLYSDDHEKTLVGSLARVSHARDQKHVDGRKETRGEKAEASNHHTKARQTKISDGLEGRERRLVRLSMVLFCRCERDLKD